MLLSSEFWIETARFLAWGVWLSMPAWLPLLLAAIFLVVWVRYRRAQFLSGKKYTLLEIKVPQDIARTPLSMEVVLNALHQTSGEGNWYDKYIKGKLRPWFSLEIASIEGAVHFFIWTDEFFKDLISAQIYSQYPNAEVYEVPDYTQMVPFGKEGSDWDLFGAEFKLKKPDPYPIKTYVDYGLDKPAKEEEKTDPLTALLEFLGSIGRGEQLWFQIIVRANKGKEDPTLLFLPKKDWRDEAEKLIDELLQREAGTRKPKSEDVQQDDSSMVIRTMPTLTQYERDIATAIQRSIAKFGFDVGIRALYLARKDAYRPLNHAGIAGSLRPFSSEGLNGFKPKNTTDFDYPWEGYVGMPGKKSDAPLFSIHGNRLGPFKWRMFDAYRRRSYFLPPYQHEGFVLSAEELATLYHFPGQVAETPTFGRVESRKAEPPTNLPT